MLTRICVVCDISMFYGVNLLYFFHWLALGVVIFFLFPVVLSY